MHVILRLTGALPSKLPHVVVVEKVKYSFLHWQKETMVYRHDNAAMRIQTRKVGLKRYVRKIVRSSDGHIFENVDGYRLK